MLTSLSIGNFKAFGETQTIPIRPLTLIFGANSSGKSSIIHSLLLANHAIESGNWDVREPKLGGGSVDLGGLAQYRHGGTATGACQLGYAFSGSLRGEGTTFEVTLTVGGSPADGTGVARDTPAIAEKVDLAIEGKPALTFTPNGRDTFRCDTIWSQNPVVKSLVRLAMRNVEAKDVGSREWEAAEAVSDALVRMLNSDPAFLKTSDFTEWMEATFKQEIGRAQAESAEAVNKAFRWLWSRPATEEVVTLLQRASSEVSFRLLCSQLDQIRGDETWDRPGWGYITQDVDVLTGFSDLGDYSSLQLETLDEKRKEEVREEVCFVMYELRQHIKAAFRSLSEALISLCYLGPLRAVPKRHRLQWEDDGPRDQPGLDSWARVASDVQAQDSVNRWLGAHYLGTAYRLKTRRLVYEDDPSKEIGPPDLLFEDSSTGLQLSHRDLGFGITQALPILVNAAFPNKGIIAIEQPELHLHPAMQAELGDVFIESALGERKNTFLLETHSEHLILRIMRRIRETHLGKLPKEKNLPPVRPSDVAVLYVEKEGPRSIVREFPLNERGELVKAWPGGFFEEGLREMLS